MNEDEATMLGIVRKPSESPREEDNHNNKRKGDRSEEKNCTQGF